MGTGSIHCKYINITRKHSSRTFPDPKLPRTGMGLESRPESESITRMHSSRMCTARLLTVSQHALHRGAVCPGGVADPPMWTEWQTGVQTLPCRNFVAGGKNLNPILCSVKISAYYNVAIWIAVWIGIGIGIRKPAIIDIKLSLTWMCGCGCILTLYFMPSSCW